GRLVFSGATQQITTAGNEHLELIPGGNVGIGRTNPAEKLDVNGHVKSQPVCARWYATNHLSPSNNNYVWGTEVFNTNSNYLSRTANHEQIEIKKAGYYRISVNVLQGGLPTGYRGDVNLVKNQAANYIGLSLGGGSGGYYKHVINIIEHFSAGDKIWVYMPINPYGAYIYAIPDAWSSLEIYRLN
ncbi:MAG: hypothetical protein GY808_12285, partial [Gammaproteobacteria bacterium]|nr:hypothetical protein [Gammaproteobacteria bacterium]